MNFMFVSNSGRRACGAVGLQGRLLGPLRREEGGVVGVVGGGGVGVENIRMELKSFAGTSQDYQRALFGKICLSFYDKTKTLNKSNEFSLKFSFHV